MPTPHSPEASLKIAVLGGTGPTGQLFTQAALAAGHELRVLSRSGRPSPAGATLLSGDATDETAVASTVAGMDAVVAFLSPRQRQDPVRSVAAAHLVRAMSAAQVKRLVWCSSAGVGESLEGMRHTSWFFSRVIIPLALKHQFADAARAEDILRQPRGLEVTILRPVQLMNGPRRGVQAFAPDQRVPSAKITRADVADFALATLSTPSFVGQAPVLCGAA